MKRIRIHRDVSTECQQIDKKETGGRGEIPTPITAGKYINECDETMLCALDRGVFFLEEFCKNVFALV